MKKKLLIPIKAVALCFLFAAIMTGCANKKSSPEANPNATGKNPYLSEPSQSENNTTGSSHPNVTGDKLSENISSSGAVTERGKLVVFVSNKNNVTVDLEIEAEFYDANGTIVGSDSNSLNAVGPSGDIAVELWGTPDAFDNYKIYVDAEISDEISYLNQLEVTHNNNGKEIAVQVKNNSKDSIDYITLSVVYYQGDRVVGIEDSIESDTKSGRSANFNLGFPYNKKYKNVNFDNYKVFINEAYSYN